MNSWEPDLDPRRIERDRAKAEEALRAQRDYQITAINPGFVGKNIGRLFRLVVVIVVLLVVGLVIAAATGNIDAIIVQLGR
jgi:hypothetical protein